MEPSDIAPVEPDAQLTLGHVLFIDIVSYSKLLVDEQAELQRRLNDAVRTTSQFRKAEAQQKLLRLPTGDGMALVFFTSPEAPVQCAVELTEGLRKTEGIPLRMGVHSGAINQTADVNDRTNVAGVGINIAQRVMDCGDAGHILLSARVAEDLAQYARWRPQLHELGECEVKHGARVAIVNLYGNGYGNPAVPAKLRDQASERNQASRNISKPTSKRPLLAAATVAVALLAAGAWFYWKAGQHLPLAGSALEKSIAVLPFENFSDDKQNAYFADGIQDEILTDLSKVADLKVISRTSVMQYRGQAAKNLRDIGRTLQVAYVLEGSVQKAANRIRVNVQLINTGTDAHVWADKYDRDIADIFAIQSELAEKIVSQLRVNLSPREKAAIEERTTNDVEAYELYLRSKKTSKTALTESFTKDEYLEEESLLNRAISRDPKFALAYCALSGVEESIYWIHDHDPARKQKAEEAIKTAMQLRPDVGLVRLAQAAFYYKNRDYEQARAALDIAGRMLPNNSEVLQWSASIDCRNGKWDNALVELQKALEVDPRNPKVLGQLADTYDGLRRYSDAERLIDRGIAAFPDSAVEYQLEKLDIALERGDTKTCRTLLDSVPAGFNPNGIISLKRFFVAYLDHDWAEATRVVDAAKGLAPEGFVIPFAFLYGQIALAQGDKDKALAAFTDARKNLEEAGQKRPDDNSVLLYKGLSDAALGKKEEAIREGKEASAKRPIAKDGIGGVHYALGLAKIYAWAGEKNLAIEQLASVAFLPNGPTPGDLQKSPDWDALRGDPRFESISDKVVAVSK